LATFSLSQRDLDFIETVQLGLSGANRSETLRSIFAAAARWRMTQEGHGDKRLCPADLEPLTDVAVMDEYLHFIDAIRDEGGLNGLDGQPSRYHFAVYPPGGWWHANGRKGFWTVLGQGQELTPDGTLISGQVFRADFDHLPAREDPKS
jgi:hypothetical protein